ncbi:class I SAM-dependent methyltransferase [Cognatishimia activa]|uniref:class I SAM-dependent methyltransferase n=1 Tax=Cognatishimia activa TaxID=1715691 RepID=UPI00222EA15A|nr:class I SAM-dependent methyltransferase [Cognatishimia activa]UZD89636.1 class I SAM-dependent methyltransferase [Cognatishimia activa]
MSEPTSYYRAAKTWFDIGALRIGSWEISLRRHAWEDHRLKEFYDRAATSWTRKTQRLGLDDAYGTLTAAVSTQTIDHPMKVLDIGIGTGVLSSALLRTLGRDIDLTGVDISPSMLEVAEDRLSSKCAALRLLQSDACDLPFADNSFDLIVCGHVVEHLCEPSDALREMLRVLRPGGQLLICITRNTIAGAAIQLMWRTQRASPKTAAGWLATSGFERIEIIELPKHTATSRLSCGYSAFKLR